MRLYKMNDAALVDDNMPPLDEVSDQEEVLTEATEESAPLTVEDAPEVDNTQKRINKITAEKYAEKRKAEDLQRRYDELVATQKPTETKAPTLEDYDYDEAAFNAASISYQVREGMASESQRLQKEGIATQQEAANQQRADSFNAQVAQVTLQHPDYQERIKTLPEFKQETLDAIMSSDKGAEIALALSEQLDLADEIANASPMVAAMKLGELSARLNMKPQIKTSAAPSPIEPLSSGGSLSKDYSEMSMEEIYSS
jgi:phage-related minor tail protein